MSDRLADESAFVDELVGDRAGAWDRDGRLPTILLRELGARGILCAEVSAACGGLGATSLDSGELTARSSCRATRPGSGWRRSRTRAAKLMEIIEGSNEICQLILAQHALTG